MAHPTTPASSEPLAYLNGEFVPHRDAKLPVWDLGIVQAVTVTEAIRTFRHAPFRLEQHLARLKGSLSGIGLAPSETLEQLRHLVARLIEHNSGLIDAAEDLAAVIFVTAGESLIHSGGLAAHPGRPSICIYTYPLGLRTAARLYTRGLSLVVPSVRHIPRSIIDPQIKYRSRLHWYLADREAQQVEPAAEALLLDLNGFVTETAKGNLFALIGGMVQTPYEDTTLGGISQQVVEEFLLQMGYDVEPANITPDELARADEVWVSSTTTCLTPVTRLNDAPIASGQPGPIWRQVIDRWSASVGMDIVAQAELAAGKGVVC
ncbi:MAG: aminotransferase class IV [Planctomyces sp.]|nr:aminotransferase class IV [Planctomyces sp.]